MKGDVFRLNGASQEMLLWDGSFISLEPDTEIVQLTNRRIRMNLFRIKGTDIVGLILIDSTTTDRYFVKESNE